MNERIDAARRRLAESDAQALLVSLPYNRRYLSGLTAHDSPGGSSVGWLLVDDGEPVLMLGFLALEQARQECSGFQVRQFVASPVGFTAEVVRERGIRRLGFEANHLTVSVYRELEAQLGEACTLVPTEGWIDELRAVKDSGEVDAIRRAAQLTDAAFGRILQVLREGITERELAWEAEKYMRERGDGLAFDVGLASGVNTALPHAEPTDKPIRAGEPIWVDMGARVNGYCADLTRSFCLGKPDEQLLEVWDLVFRAQQAAIEGCRPGMTGSEVDALARDRIAAAGHGDRFGHSLGHGVGLVVHERPRLSATSTDVLAEGMVATFEPGVYVPGWGGVRIEDLGVIGEAGVELLSAAPKQLSVD